MYDAFVSYSHAADDLLAPRLQSGLQRFAKPWWRRRAVRVFRDESSLSASPHLWGSITEALDASSWFVLLLSPEAASSEWVNKEIDYWKADPSRTDRILPVVTDGEFGWDGDVVGSAAPPSLVGVFDSEPRWVDLRFAKGETQLDLQNPDFAAAVADIASAIRGIPKDELESEEVRQHRRTIRTAWAAAILVLLLGVAASVASVFAFNEQARANENAAEAEAQREEAETQRAAALALAEAEAEARAEADAQQAIAEVEAATAQAQALVLEAEKLIPVDPELAIHLGLAALDGFRETGRDVDQAVAVLRSAIAANRVSARYDWGGGPIAAHPLDGTIATIRTREGGPSEAFRNIDFRDVGSGSVRSSQPNGVWLNPPGRLVISPDGSHLAVVDGTTGEVVELDLDGNNSLAGSADADLGLAFSRDSRLLAWSSGAETGVIVYSAAENSVVYRTNDGGTGPSFGPDGLMSYLADTIRIIRPETGELVQSMGGRLGPGLSAWSPDGSLIAVRTLDEHVVVMDVTTGTELSRTPDLNSSGWPVWLDGSDSFLLGGGSGLRIVDARSGEVLTHLLGAGGNPRHYAPLPGTSLVAVSVNGEVLLIDTAPGVTFEVAHWTTSMSDLGPLRFIDDGNLVLVTDRGNSYQVVNAATGEPTTSGISDGEPIGPPIVTRSGLVAVPGAGSTWTVTDAITSDVLYRSPAGWFIQGVSESGSSAVIFDGSCEGPFIVDIATAETTMQPSASCTEFPSNTRRFNFSPDGDLVVGSSDGLTGTVLFDLATGAGIPVAGGGPVVSFSRDGSKLLAIDGAGVFRVFSIARLLEGFSGSEAELLPIQAHAAHPIWVAESPDGSMAATSARGEPVRLWDLTTGLPVGEFGGGLDSSESHYFDFHPTEPWLLVASPPNEIRIYTLDLDELISIAESRLSRELTEAECQQYPGACDDEGAGE